MKNQRGITLIALIITIIVMVILAAVAISVAVNDDGVISKADIAEQETEKATIHEQMLGAMTYKNNGNLDVKKTYDGIVSLFGNVNVKLIEPKDGVTNETSNVTFTVKGKKGTYEYTLTEKGITKGETLVEGGEISGGNQGTGNPPSGGETPTLTAKKLLEANYTLTVGTGTEAQTITIPEGFGVVDTTGAEEGLIEDITEYETYITAPNIENGIVIQDENGNEFVWIPVPEINDMVMCQSAGTVPAGETDGTCNITLDGETLKCTKHDSEALAGRLYADTKIAASGNNFNANLTGQTYNATSGYREPANLGGRKTLAESDVSGTDVEPGTYALDSQEWFTVYGGGEYSSTMYQSEFNLMAKSVKQYGGFYVGRYETGGFNGDGDGVVSKKGRGTADGDINNATWYKMYQMQKEFGKDVIGSSMIWGCQYDQVMKFVDGKNDFSVTEYNANRHSGSGITGTGNTPADFVANIYDLEGNMSEWTLEAYDIIGRIYRGGYYLRR